MTAKEEQEGMWRVWGPWPARLEIRAAQTPERQSSAKTASVYGLQGNLANFARLFLKRTAEYVRAIIWLIAPHFKSHALATCPWSGLCYFRTWRLHCLWIGWDKQAAILHVEVNARCQVIKMTAKINAATVLSFSWFHAQPEILRLKVLQLRISGAM